MIFTWAQFTYHWVELKVELGMNCSIRNRYFPGGVVAGMVKFT